MRRIDAHLADTMAFLTPEQQHQVRDRMCSAEFANWEGHVVCDRNEFTMCLGMCFFPGRQLHVIVGKERAAHPPWLDNVTHTRHMSVRPAA